MKFFETNFEEYINSYNLYNLHPKLDATFIKFPNKLSELGNLIFYGPSGVGKYTQMLRSIQKYSPTALKYEKKITVLNNKDNYFIKISDIHYEVNMSLLGCNSKTLWQDIYQQIVDIISSKTDKSGIIVCKNFHNIHSELLENFYSYMQRNNLQLINIKYILITEQVSFLNDNILNCCEIINIERPTKVAYSKCVPHMTTINTNNISNIKTLKNGINELTFPHKLLCNKIINQMINVDELNFLHFRDTIYDIFIYHLDVTECIWYILSSLIEQNQINNVDISDILIKTYSFFRFYNNNYRPIYHLESFLFYLISTIHGYSNGI